jgi:MazG family protein
MTHKNTPKKLESLLQIMRALRAPNGCPWDIEQTSGSLTPYILEEACELIDAIEGENPEIVLDELGDLLLQVVFQAQIYEEQGLFNFYDVAAGIGDKLIRRHPHVFEREGTPIPEEELDQQWERIKNAEKINNKSCLADHLPSKLPALQKAQKLLNRVKRDKRAEELPNMLKSLIQPIYAEGEQEDLLLSEEVLGQTLFELVRLAQSAGLDAESALRKTTNEITNQIDAQNNNSCQELF